MEYKAIEILRSFSLEDKRKFSAYLKSPFFNESNKLVKFYEALMTFYPAFDSKFLNEERLYKKINPNADYKKSTIKNLFAELAIAAENYLMQINFQSKEIESQDFLRNELFKRKLNKLIEHNNNKTSLLLKNVKNLNADYFLNRFRLITDILNYTNTNKPRSSCNFISSNIELLSERGKYITYFFTREIIKEYDNLLTLNKSFKIEEEKNFIIQLFKKIDFGDILKLVISNSNNKSYSILFELYLALYRLFSDCGNEVNYYNYKKLLLKNLEYLGVDEIRFHFSRLIRYCMIKKSNKELSYRYEKELFSIYKYILLKEYYKSSLTDYMPIELFRMILHLALDLKKYNWTLGFINKYQSKLHPERRKNMYYYSCAKYYFHRGKFDDAMRNFHKVELNHFMLKIDLKNLMLMTFYELDLYENALLLVDAYKHFLSNNKILAASEKKRYRNFIYIIQKMIMYKTSFNPMIKYLTKKSLINDIPYRDWVEEKFTQLDTAYSKKKVANE